MKPMGRLCGSGAVITYSYDALNRLTGIDYPGADKDVVYTWDETGDHGAGKGRLTTVQDESGSTAYSYNSQGNITRKVQSMPASGPVLTTQYSYTASGTNVPSSEWRFHLDIMRARPDVGAIVHTHSLYATTLGCCRKDIPAVHYMIAASGGPNIRCSAYATYGTAELSTVALAALEV